MQPSHVENRLARPIPVRFDVMRLEQCVSSPSRLKQGEAKAAWSLFLQKLSFVCPPEQIVSVFTDFEFRIDRSLQVLFMFAFKDKLDDRRIAFDAARTTGGVDEFLRGTRTAFSFAFEVSFPAR